MINRVHQGEKLYVDNLYIVYTYKESPGESSASEIIVSDGGWEKIHPFYTEVDRNCISHLTRKLEFMSEINDFDDRNISQKETNFRI